MKNNLSSITDFIYTLFPNIYTLQIIFFNGNHFKILKDKLKDISFDNILEIASGTSPVLDVFTFKKYIGVDFDPRFIEKAKLKYGSNPNYSFIVGDATKIKSAGIYDAIFLSHATHHFTNLEIKKILKDILHLKFKYLVIYDGKPIGISAPLLTKLDLGNNFRELEEFDKFFIGNNNYKIIKKEVFKSNRPFYKYPLIIAKRI